MTLYREVGNFSKKWTSSDFMNKLDRKNKGLYEDNLLSDNFLFMHH